VISDRKYFFLRQFRLIFIIILVIFLANQSRTQTNLYGTEFIKGADISALLEIEENGGVFKENGTPKDLLQILKDHGINYIRLRIWHTPAQGYNNLDKTLQMASRIKNSGLKLLLDLHYSDTWADPAHQLKPAAWQNLSFYDLKDSVYQYTRQVITALKNQNTLPDIVQIGNEIICGMLWDDGRVCDQFNTPQQWAQLTQLINEGIRGVNESFGIGDSVKIMIHIDRGGDNAGSRWFFDNLFAHNVEFDFIGLSFYPWWHGTLNDLEFNLNDLAQRYSKEIIVVETAYPWTLDWFDNTQNIVGDTSQLHQGYPATVDGQENFLTDLINIVLNVPDNKGVGLFYWESEWISVPPSGSPWENLTLFDFTGNLLSSISAFDTTQTSVKTSGELPESFQLYQNYPNPFNPTTKIKFTIQTPPSSSPLAKGRNEVGFVTLKVYDLLGREIATLINEEKSAGSYEVVFSATGGSASRGDAVNLSTGIYFYKLSVNDLVEVKKMVLIK
jgi:arabinogalactan endo-1,4-beta-galactosidase